MRQDIFKKLKEIFIENLPDTLYMSPYELAEAFEGTSQLWEEFLDDHQTQILIESKLAKLTEINARKALKKLTKGDFATQEVTALKALLDSSKLMQQNTNKRPLVVLTYIPKRGENHAHQTS